MLRKQFLVCILTVMGMLHYSAASAVTLEVQPSAPVVGLGGSVTIDIVIDGLGNLSAPSLGAFDLDLTFDNSLFSFNSATFGDPVLGNQLDLFGFGSINGATPGASAVNLFEVSLDFVSDLDTLQAGSFTLASLVFDASPVNVGLGFFGLTDIVLSDSLGGPLDVSEVTGAHVQVVPVPAALWLFGSGLIGLIGLSRRKKLLQ